MHYFSNLFWYRILHVSDRSTVHHQEFQHCIHSNSRSQWPRGLRRRSAAARLLRSWVRIPPEEWIFVCCKCCLLWGRGLCNELIARPEESYRLWWVVCDVETSRMRRPRLALGRSVTKKKKPAIGICHASYADCLLARSGWNFILTSLADSKHNQYDKYQMLWIQYLDSWWWAVNRAHEKAAVITLQDWRTQRTKHHTGPETACAAEKLLMMDTMLSETCRAE